MTATSSPRPRSAPARFTPTVGILLRNALTPLLWFTVVAAAFLVAIMLLARWQGWEVVMSPGASTDGVLLGVEVSAERVVLRGVHFLVVVGVGIGSVALAAGVPATMTRPLIELGVTRRVVAAATLAMVAALSGVLLLVWFLLVVAAAPTDPGSWWRGVGDALPVLGLVVVAMLVVLVGMTFFLRNPGWVASIALLGVILAVGFAPVWLGIPLPVGPLTAAVAGAVLVVAYLALMRRMPVP